MPAVLDAAKFIGAGQGKELGVVGQRITIKLTGNETGGVFSMWQDVTPPHGGPPPHVHRWEDETFFVLEGEFEFTVGGQAHRASAGATLYCPRNVPHSFKNLRATPGQTITIATPAGFEGFFEEADRLERAGPAPIEKLAELGELYGLEFLGP